MSEVQPEAVEKLRQSILAWWDSPEARKERALIRRDTKVMSQTGVCPRGPHRPPQGPNEDVAQCGVCYAMTFSMRPAGETFGHHASDCSLPIGHESYCVGGGSGHPVAEKVRG